MPDVSRYMIRAALLWLLVGALSGVLILAEKSFELWPALWLALPFHIGTMIFGWMLQFVLAVAYWMLPKYRMEPLRGPALPALGACWAFNSGMLTAAAGHLLPFAAPGHPVTGIVVFIGYLVVSLSAAAFAILLFPRILSYRGTY
jgi:cbb3-type cytochrome oxidase subunit 1